MTLKTSVEKRSNGSWRVVFIGRLDTNTHESAEEKLSPLLQAKGAQVICDMSKLEYLSSMGLRVLMKLQKEVQSSGGTLLMLQVQPQIAKILEIGRALPSERIFSSVEEADRYFDLMQRKVLKENDA